MDKGWVKLFRSLIDWEYYDDKNATRLLIHLLLIVNYRDKKWRGIDIKAGTVVISWDGLSKGCKLTVSQCRTSMKKLVSSKEVTRYSTNKYNVITLLKWDKLQSQTDDNDKQDNKPPDNQIAIKSQSNDNQIATTKESNNIITKEDKKLIPKKTEKVFSEDVNRCFVNCLVFFPNELHPKNPESWKDTIEKLNRIDKYKFSEIEHVVKSARFDDFWKNQFLSILKLRKLNRDKIKYFVVFQQKFKSITPTTTSYNGNR